MAMTAHFAEARSPAAPPLEILVRGARCANCLARVEGGVRALPGVQDARLNLTNGKLQVLGGRSRPDAVTVVRAVEALGYAAAPYDPGAAAAEQDREGRRLILALGVAAFGVGNVMMFSVPVWSGLFGQELDPATRTLMYWLGALVAAPCAVFAGLPFFQSAYRVLRKGRTNMDVPISVGVILTLLISLSELVQNGAHAYFDAAVSLLFLLLIGRWLDHRLRATAQGAARDLLQLQNPVSRRLDAQGREQSVATTSLQVGDIIAVAPGERVAADGLVEGGAASLDNAMITGETAPQAVAPGQTVRAGALALDGRLLVRVTARAEDSALAAIGRLMELGAQSRSAYVRLADRAAAVYVPVVHGLALIALLAGLWLGLGLREALLRAVVVLIVTCPCALGLAVPAVQITASGRLFRLGVLVKSGAALERLAEVDTIVFDKTGVLTAGQPRLLAADARAVALAAPLARASRHPLSRSLAAAAGPGPTADDVRELAGQGVEGRIGGRIARLGRADFVGAAADGEETQIWFAFEGEEPLPFRFDDALRSDAVEAIAALRERGLHMIVLSGDRDDAVRRAAQACGIDDWRAGLTPFDKATALEHLQRDGHKVLMVGDGLNDAAALARAHASMAPGTAVDAAQNAADLVFMGEGLAGVVDAVDVARAARRRALENFAFSALYNAIAAPAAMAGLVNPLAAAVAMSGSSLVVTLNALRMNWTGGRR
jgi:Cu2+-exporting ATPase